MILNPIQGISSEGYRRKLFRYWIGFGVGGDRHCGGKEGKGDGRELHVACERQVLLIEGGKLMLNFRQAEMWCFSIK